MNKIFPVDILYRHRYLLGLGAAILALTTKGQPELSYLLITLSGVVIRFWAVGYLGTEKTSINPKKIITGGPYRLMRHPLYFANGLIVFGLVLFLAAPMSIILIILLGYIFFYTIFALYEEKKLSKHPEYSHYRSKVAPFFPVCYYHKTEGNFLIEKALLDYPAVVSITLVILIAYLI